MVRQLFRALAWSTILAVPALASQGCSSSDLTNPTSTLCCTDFKVGADLTGVDWGISGDGKVEFGAFMQASGDFTAAATATVSDLTSACQTLAVDLGAKEDAVVESDPGRRALGWCAAAAAQIQASGSIEVVAQAPSCTVSASVQGSCEAKCSAKAECQITPGNISARCEGGKISGKCEGSCSGSCQGSANVAVTCEGSCQGTCEGSCDGTCSGGLSGTCTGMCDGTCNGKATGTAGGIACDGTCEGTCSVAFKNPVCKGSCSGSCAGKCRGTCQAAADAKLECEGECSGSCDVEFKAPKCTGKLTPPSADCQGSAECSGSCSASANAKAECTPGSLEIKAAGNLNVQAQASLKANLPKILAIFQARGQLLVDTGTAVVDVGAKVAVKAPSLSLKAGLCVVPAVAAIAEAASNAGSSFEASGKVAGSLKLGQLAAPTPPRVNPDSPRAPRPAGFFVWVRLLFDMNKGRGFCELSVAVEQA
jgi:hypothetical protein